MNEKKRKPKRGSHGNIKLKALNPRNDKRNTWGRIAKF